MLDTDQLRSFVAIVDTGSFRRAADRVNKTQSAVSMQIRRLEERLNCVLFARQGRGVRLSEDGEKLVDYARQMLMLEASAFVAVNSGSLRGRVRLGLPDDYATPFLPDILASFSLAHPLVEVSVLCEPSVTLQSRIHDHDLDLAIVTDCGRVTGSEIIRETPLLWAGGKSARVDLTKPIELALGSGICEWRGNGIAALERAGLPYRVLLTSNNYAAIEPVVRAGLAFTILPAGDTRDGIRFLTESDGLPPLGLCRIGLLGTGGEMSAEAKALAQIIRTVVKSRLTVDAGGQAAYA